VEQHHDVEAAVDEVLISFALVAAITEVLVVMDDGELVELGGGLVADGKLVGVVGTGVVEDHDFRDPLPRFRRNSLQDADQRGDGVVGDDEDPDFHFARNKDSVADGQGATPRDR
jgi:hypothetical protein